MNFPDPYELVAQEVRAGVCFDSLWVRAWAESGGVEDRAWAVYFRLRASEISQAVRAAIEKDLQEERARLAEAQRAEKERKRRDREETARGIRIVVNVILGLMFLFGMASMCSHQ